MIFMENIYGTYDVGRKYLENFVLSQVLIF